MCIKVFCVCDVEIYFFILILILEMCLDKILVVIVFEFMCIYGGKIDML